MSFPLLLVDELTLTSEEHCLIFRYLLQWKSSSMNKQISKYLKNYQEQSNWLIIYLIMLPCQRNGIDFLICNKKNQIYNIENKYQYMCSKYCYAISTLSIFGYMFIHFLAMVLFKGSLFSKSILLPDSYFPSH